LYCSFRSTKAQQGCFSYTQEDLCADISTWILNTLFERFERGFNGSFEIVVNIITDRDWNALLPLDNLPHSWERHFTETNTDIINVSAVNGRFASLYFLLGDYFDYWREEDGSSARILSYNKVRIERRFDMRVRISAPFHCTKWHDKLA